MIEIKYSATQGLNSTRLILNAVIDAADSDGASGVVYVHPENHLEDIQALVHEALVPEFRTAIVANELRLQPVA